MRLRFPLRSFCVILYRLLPDLGSDTKWPYP
ncbi:Uncharacterised protein [Vibrio cholerae]|nr:Uncharacterised protein [Vibrio cholerae]CSI66761.1 Uncharacterised protein [Vibrio cholerae]